MVDLIKLDFSSLPTFERTSFFCCLESDTENSLRAFPNVFERATAAMRFCQHIGSGIAGDKEIMGVAYLRASLMELVGMEEVLPLDLESRGENETRLRINETSNVLLVMLRELRNLNLHLINVSLENEEREAVSYSSIITPEYYTFGAHLIPFDQLTELSNLKNAKLFDADELDAAIAWFNDAQSHWGITDVVKSGIETYSRLIIERYKNLMTK